MERLVRRGYSVEWFSGGYKGAAKDEFTRGIRFIRAGTSLTVHLLAFLRYARSTNFDIVIDQVNTIPFYSCYYRAPMLAWFQQLAKEVWLLEGGVIGRLGYSLESTYLRPYRKSPVITISKSSAESLREIGLKGDLHLIPLAVDDEPVSQIPEKSAPPMIAVVGRLTPSKRVEESIKAAAHFKSLGWLGRLVIVGSGKPSYRKKLERLARNKRLSDVVSFVGRVSEAERKSILDQSSLLWMTSAREGWGLVVTEAARHATPAVVYDVPGLRDSVKDGRTGRVIQKNALQLARASIEVLADFDRYASEALRESDQLTWERTVDAFEMAIASVIYKNKPQ